MTDDFESNETRAAAAQGHAAHAFARLLAQAETQHSGQIERIAQFIAASYNGEAFPFDLFLLRTVDVVIGDDMLACLDALRWGRADLYKLVPDGERRVQRVIERWGIEWPAAS